jgi:CHASE2 domain
MRFCYVMARVTLHRHIPEVLWEVWRPVLFIPSVLVLLQFAYPALAERIEDLAIQIAFAVTDEPSVSKLRDSIHDPRVPLIVEIDKPLFMTAFRERTPLDRTQLTPLIRKVLDGKPGTLVVDIDLSPVAYASEAEKKAQSKLDELLRTKARDGQSRIVLMTPIGVPRQALAALSHATGTTKDLLTASAHLQLAWMKGLCDAGVHFGLHELYTVNDVIVRYDPTMPTLGVFAAQIAKDAKNPQTFRQSAPCEAVGSGELESAYFLFDLPNGLINPDAVPYEKLRAVKISYLQLVPEVTVRPAAVDELPTSVALEGRTVFVGGSYGGDIRQSAIGTLHPGVALHAAQYFSETRPVLPLLGHLAAYLAEILVGMALAFILHWLWSIYFHTRYASDQTQHRKMRLRKTLPRVLISYVLGVAVIVVCVLSLYMAFKFTARLIERSSWLNPQPFVIGIMLKTLLSSWQMSIQQYGRAMTGGTRTTIETSETVRLRHHIASVVTVAVSLIAVSQIVVKMPH